MAGTKEGGIKARNTNRERHGSDWYARIGRIGGTNGHTGGFASEVKGEDGLTGPERARIAGAKGGRISKRGKSTKPTMKNWSAGLTPGSRIRTKTN